MARNTRKGSFLAGWLFLFSAVMFTVAAIAGFKSTHDTVDKVLKIGTPALMLIASVINFVRASRLPRTTE